MPRAGIDRATVVAAAATLADQEGLSEVTLARLAKQFGVRPPSLYNHISGTDDLWRELALLGSQELTVDLMQASVGRSGADAVQALATAYRAFARRRPGLYVASLLAAPPPDDPELQAAAERILAIVLAVLREFQLHDAAALHAVRGLRSLLHGFVTLELAGGFGLPLDLDTSFQQLVATYLAGLTASVPA